MILYVDHLRVLVMGADTPPLLPILLSRIFVLGAEIRRMALVLVQAEVERMSRGCSLIDWPLLLPLL